MQARSQAHTHAHARRPTPDARRTTHTHTHPLSVIEVCRDTVEYLFACIVHAIRDSFESWSGLRDEVYQKKVFTIREAAPAVAGNKHEPFPFVPCTVRLHHWAELSCSSPPKKPAGHGTGLAEPAAQKWPRVQGSHCCSRCKPVPLPKNPAGQYVGDALPAGQ